MSLLDESLDLHDYMREPEIILQHQGNVKRIEYLLSFPDGNPAIPIIFKPI